MPQRILAANVSFMITDNNRMIEDPPQVGATGQGCFILDLPRKWGQARSEDSASQSPLMRPKRA